MTVKLRDLVLALHRGKPPETTAHVAGLRFYRKHLRQNKTRPSLLDRAAALPSRFSIEEFLSEIEALPLRRKLREQLRETCRVRLAELRGVIP